ncbi:SDR family NAD(P)-dependent oxidoreductase [Micromonospora inyonensis]|uniref:Short-chain dehydrogenase n=1 Tax=Micromonospora inyonensis TaxID=47866 RepID=A0A1C6SEK2_9ACTN|nr:SDR family oxidoreductase [Micromonospora inyonensis]SCL27778.1 Short-chain dehydrogenase [Micromonospora inyonensis]
MTAVPPSFDLTGRLAVVTGAARGLGAAFAAGLAAAGADLVLVDRPGVDLGPVAEQVTGFGRAAHRHPFDLADTEAIAGWVDDLRAAHGPLHILVNNAGVARLEHFNEITVAGWRELMRVNVDAVFFCAQRVAEHMIADGVSGRIVNISSKNGLVAEAGLAHYNASKGAVELLTRSLAAELGPHGITANTIAPGMIDTPIDGEFPFNRAAFEAAWEQRIPAARRVRDPRRLRGCAAPARLGRRPVRHGHPPGGGRRSAGRPDAPAALHAALPQHIARGGPAGRPGRNLTTVHRAPPDRPHRSGERRARFRSGSRSQPDPERPGRAEPDVEGE